MTDNKKLIINILKILQDTDKNSPITANKLVEELEKPEYNTPSYRQRIYPLIETLKECGYPIVNAGNQGYYMDHESAFEVWQLRIMCDSLRNTMCMSSDDYLDFQRKLFRLTGARGRKKLLAIYSPNDKPEHATTMYGEYLDTIMEAVLTGKTIRFQYTNLNEKLQPVLLREGAFYELHVYALSWSENGYYIIGGHEKHRPELTKYRIDRMRNVCISDFPLIEPRKFLNTDNPHYVLKNYIAQEVDHYSGLPVRLKLEFDPKDEVGLSILYDFAGEECRIEKVGKMMQASFIKANTPTLIGWLVKYAAHVKLVEPKELKQDVIEYLKYALRRYET